MPPRPPKNPLSLPRSLTQQPCHLIGLLLLDHLVVECLKEYVQDQHVLPVGIGGQGQGDRVRWHLHLEGGHAKLCHGQGNGVEGSALVCAAQGGAVPYYAVPCHPVPLTYYAIPCCVVPCFAMPSCAVPSHMLCYATSHGLSCPGADLYTGGCAMPYCASSCMLRDGTWRYHAMSQNGVPCQFMYVGAMLCQFLYAGV